VAATFFVGRLRARVWGTGAQQASTDSRIDQWNMAIPKIIKNPIGYGWARGARTLGFTNGDGVLTIDSYYLNILLEVGILGFILYYGMFGRAIWTGAKTVVQSPQSREIDLLIPLSVSLAGFIVVKSVFSQEANHPLVFMMLAAVVALAYRAKIEREERTIAHVRSTSECIRHHVRNLIEFDQLFRTTVVCLDFRCDN
jgi:O-antigen ligase